MTINKATEVLVEELLKLGLLEGTVEKNLEDKAYMKFYMHRAGHWLGSDVHDACSYVVEQEDDFVSRIFEPGMVVTVEPGLYFQTSLEGVPAEYLGIGIRIEDDVVVTETGNEILTAGVPKFIDEIEALMARG